MDELCLSMIWVVVSCLVCHWSESRCRSLLIAGQQWTTQTGCADCRRDATCKSHVGAAVKSHLSGQLRGRRSKMQDRLENDGSDSGGWNINDRTGWKAVGARRLFIRSCRLYSSLPSYPDRHCPSLNLVRRCQVRHFPPSWFFLVCQATSSHFHATPCIFDAPP